MTLPIAGRLVMTAVGLSAAYGLSRQCRRPGGWLGRRVARAMNFSHGGLTAWGLGFISIEPRWRILDVGCGGGRTIHRMAALASEGHVDGVDYSVASVATARETNAQLIQTGRVTIQQASVSQLPFAEGTFDFVTAVETHYYWPDLHHDLRELFRVLKPLGRLAIIAETYKGRRADWLYRPVMRLLFRATYLSLDEHRAALAGAGFVDVMVHEDRPRGRMCVIGTRPGAT